MLLHQLYLNNTERKKERNSSWKGRGMELPEASALKTAKRDNQAKHQEMQGRRAGEPDQAWWGALSTT